MPNGPEQQPTTPPFKEKIHDRFWNFFSRKLGPSNPFRYRTIRGQSAYINVILSSEITYNNALINSFLKPIEESWDIMDGYLWERNKLLLKHYEEIGHYDDVSVINLEVGKYLGGTGFGYDSQRGGYYLEPLEVLWSDGNKEELHIFGTQNIRQISAEWERRSGLIESRLVHAGADAEARRILTDLRTNVNKLLADIFQIEQGVYNDLLQKLTTHTKLLAEDRRELLRLAEVPQQYVRFRHTYKVIKPFVMVEIKEDKQLVMDNNGDLQIVDKGLISIDDQTKIPPKMEMYFNPDDNKYIRDLRNAEQQIQSLGLDIDTLHRQADFYKEELDRIRNQIKVLMARVIKEDFKEELMQEYRELEIPIKEKEIQDLTEIWRKITELYRILIYLKIKSIKTEQYKFDLYDLQGRFLRSLTNLRELLEALSDMDDNIFDNYVNRQKNDFGMWIKDHFDKELGELILKFRTKNEIIRVIEQIDSASNKQYIDKLNELFVLINSKLTEYKIMVDRDTNRYFEDDKTNLRQLRFPINDTTINEKRVILRELYKRIIIMIKSVRNQLRDFQNELSRTIDELADLPEEEIYNKRDELFNLIETKLKAVGIEENKVKEFIDAGQIKFAGAFAIQGIITLKESESEFSQKRNQLISLSFKKRQIEIYLNQLSPKHPNFGKRDNEVDYGLDENGYPLEIGHDGTVLLDKWWDEIRQNDWQIMTIAKKEGGAEVLKKNLGLDVQITRNPDGNIQDASISGIPTREVRKVDPKFAGDEAYIDLLEMAVYIYNEVDSIRDDLRDGRYHPYSKTTTDYIIHAEGGLKINPNTYKKTLEPLKRPINLQFDRFKSDNKYGYVQARPDYFNENVPPEELAVKRAYQILEYDIDSQSYKLGSEKERKPTSLNPAFDRRAINAGEKKFIHWGRMYYYDTTDGINKWSENPYPQISTRGIAKYIMYWIAVRTQTLQEATDAAQNALAGYDIGIRRPLVKGEFIKNMFRDMFSIGGG